MINAFSSCASSATAECAKTIAPARADNLNTRDKFNKRDMLAPYKRIPRRGADLHRDDSEAR